MEKQLTNYDLQDFACKGNENAIVEVVFFDKYKNEYKRGEVLDVEIKNKGKSNERLVIVAKEYLQDEDDNIGWEM